MVKARNDFELLGTAAALIIIEYLWLVNCFVSCESAEYKAMMVATESVWMTQ